VEDSLISQGVELMLFGMGTVVLFLTTLVFVTAAMSALVRRYLPSVPEPAVAAPAAPEATLVAVISAAIHKHRSQASQRDKAP
jgi:oxaloacetate decarboxylase gamma subunit